MSRRNGPQPFYRPSRNLWYVQIEGKQVNLGPDKAEAFRRYHALMAAGRRPSATGENLSVAELFSAFLDWCQKHRKPRTYEGHKKQLRLFRDAMADPWMPAGDLRPHHLIAYVDSRTTWGNTTKNNALRSVQRAYSWALKVGHIDRDPVAATEKPAQKRRETPVTPEKFAAVMRAVADGDPYKELLRFLWLTGARPKEAMDLEARHYQPGEGRVAFPPEEAKGGKRWRFIYLCREARSIVERLAGRRPSGRLFRNKDGNPWTRDACNCRNGRLKDKVGFKLALYDLRHGYCQRLLENGADHLTVAALLGHADGQMVARVYSHLNQADGHLRRAAEGFNHPGGGDVSA